MFAGSFRGITQTVPLAIYDRFSTDFTSALALSAVLVAISAALLLSVKLVRATAGVSLQLDARAQLGDRARRGARRSPRGSASRSRARAARGRRACCGSSPGCCAPDDGLVRWAATTWLDTGGVDLPPERGAAATCSRSTRCSPT